MKATARANANIAFIKYWGNRDDHLRLPVNDSLSMNLDGLYAETSVTWQPTLTQDNLTLNDQPTSGAALMRVAEHLQRLRARLSLTLYAEVVSRNNFPMGAGIASSAAAFAALTAAAVAASGSLLDERELTTLARLGSGSASRSVPTGFVEWFAADTHEASYAQSIAGPDHWALMDVVAVISSGHKAVGSQDGHRSAQTSDLQAARVSGAGERMRGCKQAVLTRDFAAFAEVVEHDSNLMHAVMMTSRPPLFYWLPGSLTVMEAVRKWRRGGLRVCYTLDAGPNVHCLCMAEDAEKVVERLHDLGCVEQVLTARPGTGVQIVEQQV